MPLGINIEQVEWYYRGFEVYISLAVNVGRDGSQVSNKMLMSMVVGFAYVAPQYFAARFRPKALGVHDGDSSRR